MNFSFHPAARAELIESVAYYQQVRQGLGLEFSREIIRTINRVIMNPFAWSSLSENTRRCLVTRFPFGVIYRVFENKILIVAVTQLNRRPGYWEERVNDI
jgi:hypothetical protein